jgi:hypothetical protein
VGTKHRGAREPRSRLKGGNVSGQRGSEAFLLREEQGEAPAGKKAKADTPKRCGPLPRSARRGVIIRSVETEPMSPLVSPVDNRLFRGCPRAVCSRYVLKRSGMAPTIWLEGRSTVGKAYRHELRLRVMCRFCPWYADLELPLLRAAFGEDLALIDRSGLCPACGRGTILLGSNGKSTPFLPLRSPS